MIKMITLPDSGFDSGSSPELFSPDSDLAPMSRTAQYRKVMKPLLERKRRARINRCLDDLKDIMVAALQSEGESITKLEKADVLELTVRHLRKLKQQNALGLTPQATYAGRFKAGYAHCAQEVSKFVTAQEQAAIDVNVSTRLLSHLGGCIQALETMPPSVLSMVAPQTNYQLPPPPQPEMIRKRPFDFDNNDLQPSSQPHKVIKLEHHQRPSSAKSSSICSSSEEKAWRPW